MKERQTAFTSSFTLPKAEAVRLERTWARTPGDLARRCTTVCATPPKCWRKVWESNPQESSKLRQFSGLLGVPVPNLPLSWQGRPDSNRDWRIWSSPVWPLTYAPSRCVREDSNLHTLPWATTLQAAAEPFRPLTLISYSRKKTDEGGERAHACDA